jgi:hypothetical protein
MYAHAVHPQGKTKMAGTMPGHLYLVIAVIDLMYR